MQLPRQHRSGPMAALLAGLLAGSLPAGLSWRAAAAACWEEAAVAQLLLPIIAAATAAPSLTLSPRRRH